MEIIHCQNGCIHRRTYAHKTDLFKFKNCLTMVCILLKYNLATFINFFFFLNGTHSYNAYGWLQLLFLFWGVSKLLELQNTLISPPQQRIIYLHQMKVYILKIQLTEGIPHDIHCGTKYSLQKEYHMTFTVVHFV